jgi:hypothetical protein
MMATEQDIIGALYRWAELEYARRFAMKGNGNVAHGEWRAIEFARRRAERMLRNRGLLYVGHLFDAALHAYAAHAAFNIRVAENLGQTNYELRLASGELVHRTCKGRRS